MRRFLVAALATLVVAFAAGHPGAPVSAQVPAYAGWVVDAYPQISQADFAAMFRNHRANGANFVWIGHNNPVAVDPYAWEVALSYATYEAAVNPADPRHDAALWIIEGQKNALRAARATGMPVVLPIGYRTQMGQVWSDAHPSELRRYPDGSLQSTDGHDASPYSEVFRNDNVAYYAWVQQEFVAPFRDVIMMLMLSNEPTGFDYSPPANRVFQERYGYPFEAVGDLERAHELGEFQANIMVDYARWAANQWLALDPAVTVTIAFDGNVARKNLQAPVVEPLFRDMPPNFEPAFDLQIRNGGPGDALNDSDVTEFGLMASTLGLMSARHQRPYWLWTAGNSWGLGQASADPSNVADAVVNIRAAANLGRQSGGILRGIAVWAYNVRAQGLYNDQYRTIYNPDDLFRRVSAQFAPVRAILQGPPGSGPEAIVIAPSTMSWRMIGEQRLARVHDFRPYNLGDLVSLVRSGANPAVVENLDGVDLANVRMIVVLARESRDLPERTQIAIRNFRQAGGTVVSTDEVSGVNGFQAQFRWQGIAPELFFADKTTAEQIGPVEALGLPRLRNSFVFTGPNEVIAYGGASFDAAEDMRAWLRMPGPARAVNYGYAGVAESETPVAPGLSALQTRRHTYSIISFR